jgi:hypothetical protein
VLQPLLNSTREGGYSSIQSFIHPSSRAQLAAHMVVQEVFFAGTA